MTEHKRASMREGPLAALFQRTEEAQDRAAQAAAPQAEFEPVGFEPESVGRDATAAVSEATRRLLGGLREDRAPAREVAPSAVRSPVLRVVGVGGAGVNAVNRMIESQVTGVEFIAINTDRQSLEHTKADVVLAIGEDLTRGLGTGSDPGVGLAAAERAHDRIKALLKGSDMVFVAVGAGGGTGTGAGPVVARAAKEAGALVVAIVTRPFAFEGNRRKAQADRGVEAMQQEVDTLIVVPNNRLLSVLRRGTSVVEAFRVADDVLRQGVQGISDLVTLPGLINLDFADVRTVMANAGQALLGIGMSAGESRAVEAAERAISSPLLETSIEGARSILLSITGGPDLTLYEVSEAARAVREAASPDAEIIFGASIDGRVGSQVWVTVVATGTQGPTLDERLGRRRRDHRESPAGTERGAGDGRAVRAERSGPSHPVEDVDIPDFLRG